MRRFKNTLIKAPAGSGKTTKLVERFLELIKSGKSISEIVAITFTNKATAEMQERVLKKLLDEDLSFLQENYFSKNIDFRISTIHSFLKNLLSIINPFENPSLQVAIESEDEKLFEYVVKRKIRDQLKKYPCLEAFSRKRLVQLLLTMQKQIPISVLWAEDVIFRFKQGYFEDFFELSNKFFFELAEFFYGVFLEYSELKASKGYITYSDMVYRAYEAVVKNENLKLDLLAAFNERISAILLDEFQDTDYLQWKTIKALSEDWLSGVGLREVEDASIFLIGDPMQSIYGFRGADPTIMLGVLEEFEDNLKTGSGAEEHFEIEFLEKNYRSLPVIVDFVNGLFSRLFESSDIPYEGFLAERDDPYEIGEVVVAELSTEQIADEEGVIRTDAAVQLEAEFIAKKIKEMVEKELVYSGENGGSVRKLGYKDVAVLLKTTTKVSVYEEALTKHRIPFVSEDTGFTSLKPFEFLRRFFLLSNPVRIRALLPKILKLLGYEDFLFESIEDVGNLAPYPLKYLYEGYITFKNSISGGPYLAYKKAVSAIEPLLDRVFRTEESSVFLDHSLKLFDEIFYSIEKEGIASAEKLAGALDERISEMAPKISHDLNAVTLMTIHKAKGLEFPVVFAAGLYSKGKQTSFDFFPFSNARGDSAKNYHLYLSKPDKKHFDFESKIDESVFKALNAYHNKVKKAYSEFKKQEELRLFYVAFTRARDKLFICLPDLKNGTRMSEAYKLLLKAVGQIDCSLYNKVNMVDEIIKSGKAHLEKGIEKKESEIVNTSVSSQNIVKHKREYDFQNFLRSIGYKKPEKRMLRKAQPPSRRISPEERFRPEVITGKFIHEEIAYLGLNVKDVERALETLAAKLEKAGADFQAIEVAKRSLLSAAEWLGNIKGENEIIGFEVPYILILDEGMFREGRIDFLYRDSQGNIFIVDFKFEADSQEARKSYESQLSNYVEAVKLIFGTDKVNSALKFLK